MNIGNYEAAIAVAPKVSLKYWQQCIKGYIQYLDDAPKDNSTLSHLDIETEKINYLLLANQVDEASLLMHQRGETQEAKAVKALKISGFFQDTIGKHERVQVPQGLQPIKQTINSLGPQDRQLDEFTCLQARAKFNQNLPILAAATHLSLSDAKKAIQKLIQSNNLDYAYVVATLFYPEAIDQILVLLIPKVINVKPLLNKMIEMVTNPTLKSLLYL